jgi:hypothetical protein
VEIEVIAVTAEIVVIEVLPLLDWRVVAVEKRA